MFPQGGPGVALVLLRISVVASFAANAASNPRVSSVGVLVAAIVLVSLSLVAGFLTPYLSVLAGATAVAGVLMGSHSAALVEAVSVLDAAALALLGPGAYSVDARLFGRRVSVVVPPRAHS